MSDVWWSLYLLMIFWCYGRCLSNVSPLCVEFVICLNHEWREYLIELYWYSTKLLSKVLYALDGFVKIWNIWIRCFFVICCVVYVFCDCLDAVTFAKDFSVFQFFFCSGHLWFICFFCFLFWMFWKCCGQSLKMERWSPPEFPHLAGMCKTWCAVVLRTSCTPVVQSAWSQLQSSQVQSVSLA